MRRAGSVKAQVLAVIEARGALTSTEVLAAIRDLTGRVVPRETLIPELSRLRAAKCIDYHNGRWRRPMTEAEAAAEIERLTKERDDAREWGVAQIERLNRALHYDENRLNRIGTHGVNCWKWGPSHYECAMREIERQRQVIEIWREGYIEQTGTDVAALDTALARITVADTPDPAVTASRARKLPL